MDKAAPDSSKKLELPCTLEVAGCGVLAGRTHDLSSQEILIQCPCLVFPGARKPKIGATGLITLTFHLPGISRETLKIPCRVAYVSSNMVGLQINVQVLNSHQRERFADLLMSKRG